MSPGPASLPGVLAYVPDTGLLFGLMLVAAIVGAYTAHLLPGAGLPIAPFFRMRLRHFRNVAGRLQSAYQLAAGCGRD